MITYAILVFAIAAVGGLVLASKVLTGRFAPWAISLVHALLGATGLIILAMLAIESNWAGKITTSLALLVIATLGGFVLASFHLKQKLPPKGLVIIHAGVAVAGFLTLLAIYFQL